jgi:hypothetical protein
VALAVRALPKGVRLEGWRLWLVASIATLTCALGVFGGLNGLGLF